MKLKNIIYLSNRTSLDQAAIGAFLGLFSVGVMIGAIGAVKNINYASLITGLLIWATISFYCYRNYPISAKSILKNSMYIVSMFFLFVAMGIAKEELGYLIEQNQSWQRDYIEYAIYASFNVVPCLFPVLSGVLIIMHSRHLNQTRHLSTCSDV